MTRPPGVPLLDLVAQYGTIREEIQAAIARVLETQHFILGPEVAALEEEIARYCGVREAVGVSSGSDALLVSLMALGVGTGDQVITTPFTFFASAGAILRLGARPVFVDIRPSDYGLDPERLESAITDRTKAVIPIHLFGQVCEMDPIMEIARRRGVAIVEDAAQAIGASYRGRGAGSMGELGCFSFYPSKNLGAFGDGGMITTNDPQLADRLRLLRSHGSRPKYFNVAVGGNFRLDALQAAVLRVKLRHLDDWSDHRASNASRYRRLFRDAGVLDASGTRYVSLPAELPERRHVFNQFVIRTGERDSLVAVLNERGIGTEIYYPHALHLQPVFAELGLGPGTYPESEAAAAECLALPIYPELTDLQARSVVGAVAEWAAASSKTRVATGARRSS